MKSTEFETNGKVTTFTLPSGEKLNSYSIKNALVIKSIFQLVRLLTPYEKSFVSSKITTV